MNTFVLTINDIEKNLFDKYALERGFNNLEDYFLNVLKDIIYSKNISELVSELLMALNYIEISREFTILDLINIMILEIPDYICVFELDDLISNIILNQDDYKSFKPLRLSTSDLLQIYKRIY